LSKKPPFDSVEVLSQAFITGLQRLLGYPGLGAYILVHANACFDAEIYQRLKGGLAQRFNQLVAYCREALSEGQALAGAEDDQLVFLKLMAIGFEDIRATEFRQTGGWELQFNHVRAFRPSRISRQPVLGISRPFDPNGFNFNKPYLRKEVFWAGELLGEEVELLYNKFPFAPLHGLLVPDRRARHEQFLSRRYHNYAWRLAEDLGAGLPGLGIAYNSYGAYASVNHLHFQLYVRSSALPLENGRWNHNGGGLYYPLSCKVFSSASEAWAFIETLHEREISYNLIYRPGRLYCFARKPQGSYGRAPWTHGFAWYELAGGITTFSRSDFDTLDATAIEQEMMKLQV
jgi:diadenosine tetraphosphate (Ap4A) HIT family hydrolase